MWRCNFPSKPDHICLAVKGSEGTRSRSSHKSWYREEQISHWTFWCTIFIFYFFIDFLTWSEILRKGLRFLWTLKQTANHNIKDIIVMAVTPWMIRDIAKTNYGESSPNTLLALEIDLCVIDWFVLMWFECDSEIWQGKWCKWKSKTSLSEQKKRDSMS